MDPAFEPYLRAIERSLSKQTEGGEPDTLYEPIRYVLAMGAKRVRPLLSLLAFRLFRSDWEAATAPAAAVEVFHNFTLVHDDLMDEAPLRRGQQTVHQRWGGPTAILSGDAMLVKAYQLLAKAPADYLPPLLEAFNRAALGVCEGQQLDMDYEQQNHVSEEAYLEMIRLKTGVLLGYALESGGILAGQPRGLTKQLRQIGELMGVAFQLKDDLLDAYGDPEKFGKALGGDIRANKKTYLLLYARQNASPTDAELLENWLAAQDFDPEEKVRQVKAIFDRCQVEQACNALISKYFEQAQKQLEALPLHQGPLQELQTLAKALMGRQK